MFLSDLHNRPVVVNDKQRGVCQGIGISLKNQAVKYLLCASNTTLVNATDFSINVSAIDKLYPQIHLSRLRPVFPKSCAKLFLDLPIYSFDGGFLGELKDVELQNFTATRLFTELTWYPISAILACSDALILRKEQPFPIGQRIPAPFLFHFSNESTIVTKALLKEAAKSGKLIAFTLSLAPFHCSL